MPEEYAVNFTLIDGIHTFAKTTPTNKYYPEKNFAGFEFMIPAFNFDLDFPAGVFYRMVLTAKEDIADTKESVVNMNSLLTSLDTVDWRLREGCGALGCRPRTDQAPQSASARSLTFVPVGPVTTRESAADSAVYESLSARTLSMSIPRPRSSSAVPPSTISPAASVGPSVPSEPTEATTVLSNPAMPRAADSASS